MLTPEFASILHRAGSGSPLPDDCLDESRDYDHPSKEHYNFQLHITGVLIILAASTAGVFVPLIASCLQSYSSFSLSSRLLTLGKQFGTGIIFATAFIHMMPTAMSNLSSPCLGRLFSENYTALGGLIILSSSLAMHWIEFMVMEHTQHRIQKVAEKMNCDNQAEERGKRESKLDSRDSMDFGGLGATGVATGPCPGHTVTILDQAVSRRSSWSSVSSYVLDHVSQETEQASDPDFTTALQSTSKLIQPLDPSLVNSCDARPNMAPIVSYGSISSSTSSDAIQNRAKPPNRHHHHLQEVAHSHAHSLQLLDHSQRRISTYILEAGVAAHSIIIGVTLGVSSGAEFMSLLVALVFYQFFEGFALGVRIADLELDKTYTHFMLALIFSLTTPLGAVIAIGISNSYNSMSAMAILMEGTFDAISAGILLYMGYVNLLAVEFNQNGEIRKENNSVKSMFFLALWAGAAAMAVIGLFA